MDKQELRRKIAEALGWSEFEKYGWDDPAGPKPLWATKDGKPSMDVPDWPTDPGAAYMLCVQVAGDNDWRLITVPDKYVSFEAFAYTYSKWQEVDAVYLDDDAPIYAEALARLALAALEGGSDANHPTR